VVRKWVMELPPDLQVEMKASKVISPSDWEFNVVLETAVVIDSHIHCDVVLSRSGLRSWGQVMRREELTFFKVETYIYSCNFPDHWSVAEELADYPKVYLTVGLHPHVVSGPIHPSIQARQSALMRHPKCIAIGEVGLDYDRHRSVEKQHAQRRYLQAVLLELQGRPLVIHCRSLPSEPRKARDDLLKILTGCLAKSQSLLVHSFCGDERDVLAWLTAFPNTHFGLGKKCPEAFIVSKMPLDQIVIESDAPYQCSSPADLKDVLDDVSKKVNIPLRWLGQLTRENTRRFFRL